MAKDYFNNEYDEIEVLGGYSGRVLVATSQLDGSVFEKSLIFVCVHDEEGAVGVIFNKVDSLISSEEIFDQFKIKKRFKISKNYPIYCGGPVDEDKMVILSANKEQERNFSNYAQLTFYTDAESYLQDVVGGQGKSKFILFKGFCGWAPGQLEQEVQENSWIVVDADFKTIFSKSHKGSWEKYVKKLGINNFDKLVSYSGIA